MKTAFAAEAPKTIAFSPKRIPSETGRIAKLLHAFLLATALVVFAWPIALPSGLIVGALGAAYGSQLASRLVERRYRLFAILLFALGVLLSGALVIYLVSTVELVAGLLSPVAALHLLEALRWGSVALSGALALRAIGIRYRAALAMEGGVVVLAVATTVAAHRDGMIARPLEISDWFWTQGIDPVLAFLMIGLVGALLLAGILAYGRSSKRTLAQLVFVLFLGIFLAIGVHGADVATLRKNPSGTALDSKSENRPGQNGGGGSSKGESAKDNDPLPSNNQSNQQRPAAIVVFHKDVTPAAGVFYFRHAAFSQYNGIRLVETSRSDVDQDAVRNFPSMRQDVPQTIKDSSARTLVATDVALLTDHNRLFALTDASELSPMPNPEPARFRRAYHVVSSVVTEGYQNLLGSTPGDPGWADEVWEYYTELPKDERYRKLADEIRESLRPEYREDPVAEALSVKRYLEENATYSFARSYEGSEDPTAAFLFSYDKRGYCVHLAHAATYLLRALGVPARVSAGYAVPASNLGGGSALLIKSGDAHAWAEMYLTGIGWVPVEVTPEKTDIKPSSFREKDLQQLLGEMARKEGRDSRDSYQGPTLRDAIRALLRTLPYVLLGALLIAYLTKGWRLLAPVFTKKDKQPRIAYRAALDWLSMVGLNRTLGEPRERFARRVGDLAPSFGALTAANVGVALGSTEIKAIIAAPESARDQGEGGVRGDELLKPPRTALPTLTRSVAREVRKRVPWWRWLVGALNPISWLWSR
jgi:hypothetical protein